MTTGLGISYRPPTENLAIFDSGVFLAADMPLTYNNISGNFLKFPVGQGTETIPALIVPGSSTLGVTSVTDLNASGTATFNGISYFNDRAHFDVTTFDGVADFDNTVNINSSILSLTNGAFNTTLYMNPSNNLVINNNTAGGNMSFNIRDPTLNQVCNTLSYTKSNGLNSSCSVLNNPPTTSANFICFTASSASTTTALQLCVSPNSGSYNNLVAANDPFIVGTGAGSNLGSLVLTTWSSSRLGIRINSNGVNNVEVAGATIQLNATSTGGLTSTTPQPAYTDSSTKIPTTAWVQSAISSGGTTSPLPYYQSYYFISNTSVNTDRYGTVQLNFTGANFLVNDYFTLRFKFAVVSGSTSTSSLGPNYTCLQGLIDVYPARCPGNTGSSGAYGINQNLPSVSNFPLMNGSIYDGSAYNSNYVIPQQATYVPNSGRWYYVTQYSSTGYAYSSTIPVPIIPYVTSGTANQSGFGFAIWSQLLTNTENTLYLELINRGPNGTGQGITLTSNYSTTGTNKFSESKTGW
jgi:hypothetical protein